MKNLIYRNVFVRTWWSNTLALIGNEQETCSVVVIDESSLCEFIESDEGMIQRLASNYLKEVIQECVPPRIIVFDLRFKV